MIDSGLNVLAVGLVAGLVTAGACSADIVLLTRTLFGAGADLGGDSVFTFCCLVVILAEGGLTGALATSFGLDLAWTCAGIISMIDSLSLFEECSEPIFNEQMSAMRLSTADDSAGLSTATPHSLDFGDVLETKSSDTDIRSDVADPDTKPEGSYFSFRSSV